MLSTISRLQVFVKSLHENISKKKSSWCRDRSLNALADKVYTQTRSAHSDMHSITWPHYSTTMHPYISSSANWRATATVVQACPYAFYTCSTLYFLKFFGNVINKVWWGWIISMFVDDTKGQHVWFMDWQSLIWICVSDIKINTCVTRLHCL